VRIGEAGGGCRGWRFNRGLRNPCFPGAPARGSGTAGGSRI